MNEKTTKDRMERSEISRWAMVTLSWVLILAPVALEAQSAVRPLEALNDLTGANVHSRMNAFRALIGAVGKERGRTFRLAKSVADLLRNNPRQSEQIRLALISALEREGAYRNVLKSNNQSWDEAYSDYYADLVMAVASLRDIRAVNGLLYAIGTGGLAVGALADLGGQAIDSVIQKSREHDPRIRMTAINALAQFLGRWEIASSDPDAVRKARAAILVATSDSEPVVREAAASALFFFREDEEIRRRLEVISATDSYASPFTLTADGAPRFIVREAAARALAEDRFFYVIRTEQTRECRVANAMENVSGIRMFGPRGSAEAAREDMCSHYDEMGKEPFMCWLVMPRNSCTQ